MDVGIIDYIEKNSVCIMKINHNVCKICQKTYMSEYKNLKNLNKIIRCYNNIFNEQLTCKIVIGNIPFEAAAFLGIVALHEDFYNRPYTYIYKYLPHEIIHQFNGCKIKYVGFAKEWLKESLTEYIQLIIIKDILGEKFYNTQRDECIKMDIISGSKFEVNLYNFDSKSHLAFFKPLIYGRGVLLFEKLINNDINTLKKLFAKLVLLKKEISIMEFMDVLCGIINIDIDFVMNHYIKKNEVIF